MNYKELIIKAAEEKDWDQVIKLAQDAKLNSSEKTLFGIKKGYLNVFKIPDTRYAHKNFEDLYEFLEKLGYKIQTYSLDTDVTLQTVVDNYVCLFTGDNSYIGKLHKKGYHIQFFNAKIREYGNTFEGNYKKVYYINDDNNKWRFDNLNQLQALLRDAKIDSILDD
jgi:hypothetical protein